MSPKKNSPARKREVEYWLWVNRRLTSIEMAVSELAASIEVWKLKEAEK